MIPIVICDDHKIVANGIHSLFKYRKDIRVIGEVKNRAELIELLEQETVQIVLMDIRLGEESGIELTREVKSRFPQVKIIGLSMLSDIGSINAMIQSGANGYLLKNTTMEELVLAINEVIEGRNLITPEMKDQLDQENQRVAETNLLINERERSIIQLMAEGLTTRQIGEKIFLSEETIKWYRKNLLAKLQLSNAAALIKWAVDKGVL